MLAQYHNKNIQEAGCDEAGRGCLAGPVVAAAVILPKDYENILLNDSKKLSATAREKLRPEIEQVALAWAVAFVDNNEIDDINILNASFLAMHRAVDQLSQKPELLLIDGNRFNPYPDIDHECFIKGDGRYMSIAAASILAKTHRDEYMTNLDNKFPGYGWSRNMGYPTQEHRDGIRKLGVSAYHRKTFQLLPAQIELF
jgi:ribonuclease HII